MSIANVISLLGGLGFFLFGMSLLGDGLKRIAGSKLESILDKLTSSKLKAVALGAAVTALMIANGFSPLLTLPAKLPTM